MHQTVFQIIGFIAIFIVSLYFYWEEFSVKFKQDGLKYKDDKPVLPEHVLDIWFFSGLISLLAARVSFVIFNFSEFPYKWEWTPWIRNAGGDIIWLSRFPWVFINFVDGVDVSIFVFLMFVLPVIFALRMRFELKDWFRPFRKSLLALVIGAQVLALATPVSGITKGTIFNSKSFDVYLDNNFYFLIGVGISLLYVLVSSIFLTKQKSRKLRALIFSIYLSLFLLLTKLSQDYDVRWLLFVPIPALVGISSFLFGKEEPISEIMPADISKTKLLRAHADVELAVKGTSKKQKSAKR